jgi:ATP-dependent helicase/nuclease subunit B
LSASRARVWSIAAGSPFLQTLVKGCLEGAFGFAFSSDPRDYSGATIYVPTRRAARALAHAFAEALQPRTLLLPRIIPLGDPSDLEQSAILAPDALGLEDDIPPAIGDLDRRLVLTSLVEGWRTSKAMRALEKAGDGFSLGGGFTDSFSLAGYLAGLLDEFTVESIDWNRLKDLPHGDYDKYWSITRGFLEIAGEAWPEILKENELLDPAERLNRLLRNEAQRLKAEPPTHPVIAAGSTGTVPATAELLGVIARLPKGAVILPGLDQTLDERGWNLIADTAATRPIKDAQPGHPQAALKRLLHHLRIDRQDVHNLGSLQGTLETRAKLVNASSRAAEATDDWPRMREAIQARLQEGLDGVSVVEAPDEREEALAVAIALREVLEKPGLTAALITPDRALAQRVMIELKRWNIAADDSSGTPLGQMPLGGFARLGLACLRQDFNPVSVMALLSHDCMEAPPSGCPVDRALSAFEIAGLRSNAGEAGLEQLALVLDGAEERIEKKYASQPLARIDAEALVGARALLSHFVDAMREMNNMQAARYRLSEFAEAHDRLISALTGARGTTGADALALGKMIDTLSTTRANPVIHFTDYESLFETLLAECIVAPSQPVQGRIKIWGLLEARLMQADRVVMGGLNEKTWPPDVRTDPFLNRAMRKDLGLSSPERRIGQTAHDFAQALGAAEVVMTRSVSVESTPMIASRFLRRLDAFIGTDAAKALRHSGQKFLLAAKALDAAEPMPSLRRPEPSPPAVLQPLSLSVTEISRLYRDPYAIYARHILDLQPLEPLDQSIDARDKGTIIHEALAKFIKESAASWPDAPLERLLAIGRESFAAVHHLEKVGAFWWPVFEHVAAWFVTWEAQRRLLLKSSHVEVGGAITIPLADGASFRLSGRADRIDQFMDNDLGVGGLAILDYKTGKAASVPEVSSNHEPQLTLMAEMARRGGFEGIVSNRVEMIGYVSVGSTPGFKPIDLAKEHGSIEAVAQKHIAALQDFLNRLRSGQEKFIPRRNPQKLRDTGEYDHLARNKEWMDGTEEASGEA